MQSQPRPAVIFGSVLIIAICAVLASIGITAMFTSALLTKISGAVLVLVPGLTGVLQYCGTFRHSHDAALLAGTCLVLLVVPSLLLSITILIACATDASTRALLLPAGACLLGIGLGGGGMMVANLQWAAVLEQAATAHPRDQPHGRQLAAEAVGFTLIVAAIGAVAALLHASPLVESLLSAV